MAGPDIVIQSGRIIDGTGNPWYAGDIAVTNGRIVAIGKIPGGIARRVIDANGLVVSPGFIDMLGQSETALLVDNRSLSKLAQGITTEITGEGGSIAPQNALTIAAAQPSLDPYHLKIDWTTLAEYWQRLEKKGTPINIGTYVGAAQVREAVLGDVNRAPDSGRTGKDEGAGGTGHAAGCARAFHGADLSAGTLREDGRVDRTGQSGGAIWRHLCHPHAQ